MNNTKPLDFGDYCSVEQKRYGAKNEHYCFKVIGRLSSNTYIRVPVDDNDDKRIHEGMADVLECVNSAVGRHEIVRFRECDVKRWKTQSKGE